MIINDILDGWVNLIDQQRATKAKVIVFETELHGDNLDYEVINALYPARHSKDRVGPKWFVLRPEFNLVEPKVVTDEIKEILVTFGGVDPTDQSSRMYNILLSKAYSHTRRRIILGKGYSGKLLQVSSSKSIEIVKDTTQISHYMAQADIAITSKGRTIYELAKCGVPTISISQNEREQRHDFGEVLIKDLGLHSKVTDVEIELVLQSIMADVDIRRKLANSNLTVSFDGVGNIQKLIEE